MLTYTAAYKFMDGGVHAEVLDFPGVITCGKDLHQARRLLASALVEMAETLLMKGEPLPPPGQRPGDVEADVEEPMDLVLTASSRELPAQEAVAA